MRQLAAVCALLASTALPVAATAADGDFKVVLLGTGAPAPRIDRFGPATLVIAGSEKLLFDVGRGATQRLWQLEIPLGQVTTVFFTHLHSDHVVGMPDLWLTGWLPPAFGRRTDVLVVRGPKGTRAMMRALREAYRWDIRARSDGREQPSAGIAFDAADVTEGVVFRRHGVTVTAFNVDHGAHLRPALGYRIDFAGRSVVISGDTRFSENLIRFSKGTDVLVHEVFAASKELLERSQTARSIASYHTLPEDAGRVFDRVKPRLAVFTHIAQPRLEHSDRGATYDDLTERARSAYTGPLVIGEDLMTILVGQTVEVRHFVPRR